MSTKQPSKSWKDLRSWEEIIGIKELRTLVNLVKELQLDPKGLRTVEDFHTLLLKHWKQERGNFELKGDEIRNGLENGLKEQSKVRRDLLEKFRKVEELYKEFDPNIQRSVEKSFPDVLKSFQDKKMSLKTGECTIVVAGEVGAGKSSLINLLLGVQLFPTDPLKCTNTICEIRVSENGAKLAVAYSKPIVIEEGQERTLPPRNITLDLKGIKEFQECITESSDDDENPYERIEVYWPFQMLSKGVVIVDTPGIEGGQNFDSSLTKYLSKAFGFIFMINTTTAGGVQPGRLGHLLKTIVNNANDFDPKCSLFIGNKWEFVPDADKKDVKDDIFAKLTKLYPGIQPSQIHYMSVTKAMAVNLTHNARIKEHSQLLTHIEQLVPVCLRQGISANYWWLSTFLKRSEYLLRVFNNNFAHEGKDLEQKRSSLREKVQLLKRNTDECIKKLRDKVEFHIFKITDTVKNYMNSRHFLDALCDWSDRNECPKPQRKWKTSAYEASVKISSRLTLMLDHWEKQNQILKQIENEIIDVFARELGLMEDQLELLEADLVRNKSKELLQTMKPVPVKRLFKKAKEKVKATYNTLGGAISVVGTLDCDKKDTKKTFKDYNDKNKCEKMAEGSVVFLRNITECKDLQGRLRKFFAKFFTAIDDAAQRIPLFLQADEQLIETINKQIQVGTQQREMLPRLANDCSEMMGELDIYYVNNIMSFDFVLNSDIQYSREDTLGSGNFADVYKGVLTKKRKPVALKINREVVKKSNISDILTEDRIMRDLRHPNIVRYYGSSFKRGSNGIIWIMVMELCRTSLKALYVENRSKTAPTPGRYPDDHPMRSKAIQTMISHSLQIALALEHIHSKGYTHRDLKLENVLIGEDDLIKITDVGVSKLTNFLTRTCAGSPAYMAPEVLLSTQNHTEKIDIYSIAFIYWEMWFGRDIVLDMNDIVLGNDNFQGDAMAVLKEKQRGENGFRPDLRRANRPPDSMKKMLQRGWDSSPNIRPTATEFVKFFRQLEKNDYQ